MHKRNSFKEFPFVTLIFPKLIPKLSVQYYVVLKVLVNR